MTAEKSLPPMEYSRLGSTGLRVSRIALGCMSYGSSHWGAWVRNEEESIDMIKKAYEAGINFFDTANIYSDGESERVLGKALKEIGAPRGRIVISTKVFFPVYDNLKTIDESDTDRRNDAKNPNLVNRYGLSRKHIFDEVESSLKRLGVDYIDLYQIHRADPNTPMEETMSALNDLVRSGKVRYIGASAMKTWEFQKYNNVAERHGWTKFVSMQNFYNLIYREDERELEPYCVDSGIGWITYSPLATGFLAGKNRNTTRSESMFIADVLYPSIRKEKESNEAVLDRVEELAKKYGASNAQIAIAWQLTKKHIAAPIIGVTKTEQLYDLLGSLRIKLTEEEVKYLEAPYTPRSPTC